MCSRILILFSYLITLIRINKILIFYIFRACNHSGPESVISSHQNELHFTPFILTFALTICISLSVYDSMTC